ncbi:MAG: PilW family protein [Candidatus Rifleibacteriota bacterium]
MLRFFHKRKKLAFTLVEVMIACLIMSMFMYAVYRLFIGGSQSAGRAQWISGTVDQLRNSLTVLNREIKSATYPTTLFSDTFFDPCDNPDKDVYSQFYMKILKAGEPIKPPSSGETKIMAWVVCEPEKPPQAGKILKHELLLDAVKTSAKEQLANLKLKTEAFKYTTDKTSEYARSGKLNLTPIAEETKTKVLINDVQHVEFSVAGNMPPEKPVDFFPISVTIRTLYPKDERVFKENSIMATPQVGIDTF